MRKLGIITVFIMLTVGCVNKSRVTISKSIIENKTEHAINILFYKDGKEATSIIPGYLKPNSTTEVSKKVDDPTSFAVNLIPYDSLKVLFGQSAQSTHFININGNNEKAIRVDNLRNLSTGASWQKKTIENSKKRLSVEYKYTFGIQDYLDAVN